jgi:plasmid maintenance system antidote protein VapI
MNPGGPPAASEAAAWWGSTGKGEPMPAAGQHGPLRKKPQKPHVGQLIRAEMEARGLTVKALASLADRPVNDLRDLFAGGLVRMSVMHAIGRAFGTGPELWLGLAEECDALGRRPDGRSAVVQRPPVRRGPRREDETRAARQP